MSLMTGDELPRLAYLALLAVAVAGWFLAAGRTSVSRLLQQAAIWVLIFLGVIAAIGLWPEIRSAAAPRQQVLTTTEGSKVEVPRGLGGHYYATILVNGSPVMFTVDTGATDIVLSRRDAEVAGIDLASLSFLGEAMTANGPVRTARVTLDRMDLEGIVDEDMPAVVTDGPLDASLLGMSYLARFGRIEIVNNRLLLSR
jgi:aspartyl protease family protein